MTMKRALKILAGGAFVLGYGALVAINLHNGELAAAGLLAAAAAMFWS